jgi:hypothetical protein
MGAMPTAWRGHETPLDAWPHKAVAMAHRLICCTDINNFSVPIRAQYKRPLAANELPFVPRRLRAIARGHSRRFGLLPFRNAATQQFLPVFRFNNAFLRGISPEAGGATGSIGGHASCKLRLPTLLTNNL